MSNFEDYGLSPEFSTAQQIIDVKQVTELAVATYSLLGLVRDRSKCHEAFAKGIARFTEILPQTTVPMDIVIAPEVGALSFYGLLDRYEEALKGAKGAKTYLARDLWDQYSDSDLNQGQSLPIEPCAFLLGAGDNANEPGLKLTNMDVAKQRLLMHDGYNVAKYSSIEVIGVSPAAYIVRQTMQLVRGGVLMDTETCTRFTELEPRLVGCKPYIPMARTDGRNGAMHLESASLDSTMTEGVRAAIRPK